MQKGWQRCLAPRSARKHSRIAVREPQPSGSTPSRGPEQAWHDVRSSGIQLCHFHPSWGSWGGSRGCGAGVAVFTSAFQRALVQCSSHAARHLHTCAPGRWEWDGINPWDEKRQESLQPLLNPPVLWRSCWPLPTLQRGHRQQNR